MNTYSHKISKDYIQLHSELEREVFIRALNELNLSLGFVINVLKPLYEIPESGLNWYLTYLRHYLDTFQITRAKSDPCVLIRRNEGIMDGLIYESPGIDTTELLDEEELAPRHSDASQDQRLTQIRNH